VLRSTALEYRRADGRHALTSCRDLFAIPEAGSTRLQSSPKPLVVKGMVRAILRGTAVARVSKQNWTRF
jgi:hypothetical protein